MNALLIAALLAVPAPSRDQILRDRASRQSNAREKALQREILYSAPILPPGALGSQETVQVPIVSTKVILSDGRVLELSGVLTGTITSPAPVPPLTRLTGIRDPATALLVTKATPGQRLVLEGEQLLSETIRLTVGGEIAPVTRQSAGMLEFTVPPVPAGRPPVLILYWLQANNWVEKGRLPLTVTSSPVPVPVPGINPRVDSLENSGGQIILNGSGFGAAAGRVMLDKRPLTVVGWTDASITCLSRPEVKLGRLVLDLWRPGEGWFTELWGE